jgi:hypothetical protein
MKAWLVASALLAGCASTATLAAGLEISQFDYRASDLLVFVKTPAVAASASAAAASASTASVALGTQELRVKSVETWNPASGASVVVSMDVSQSMRSLDFPAVNRAVADALHGLSASSRAGLLTIGANVQTPVEIGPVSAVTAALESLPADAPETALNEGLIRAQDWAMEGRADLPLRRFVLLVTDGVDDSKKAIGTVEMRDKVRAGEVPIYMVAILKPGQARQRQSGLEPLAGIARASGGAFMTSTLATLRADLQTLLANAQQAQLVTAACDGCIRDGTSRELQVRLVRGGNLVSDVRQVRLLHRPGDEVTPLPPPPRTPVVEKSFFERLAEILNTTESVLKSVLGIATAIITFWLFLKRKVIVKQARQVGHTVAVWVGLIKKDPRTTIIETGPRSEQSSVNGKGKPVQLTVDVDGVGRQEISVGPKDVVMGRSANAGISAPHDEEASAKHAALYIENGLLMLRDLGSANGTTLNGTPIKRAEPVHDHDVVRFGRTHVRIYFGRL